MSIHTQARSGWSAVWIASTAAIVALLTMAAPASGQESQVAAIPPPVTPTAEAATEVVPTEAPEVAPVVEEATTSAPPPAPTPSSPASDAARAVSDVTADGAAVAAPEVNDQPVSGLVARAGEETSRTLESTSEAAAAAPLPEKIATPVAQVAKGVDRLSDEAQARALDLIASAEKTVLPALPGQAPADPAVPPNQTLPLHQAPVGKSLLTGAWLGLLPEAGESVPATHTADTAAIDLLSVESPNGSIDLAGAKPLTILASAAGSIPHFNGPVSPSDPGPLGSTTGLITTSGSGASFFVPIAALLALLALASPAILRRLRELPDFPAPTPFVCALERPG
jgi:hypothetical protein